MFGLSILFIAVDKFIYQFIDFDKFVEIRILVHNSFELIHAGIDLTGAGPSEPRRDRAGKGLQRNGPTQTLLRSKSPRFTKQTPTLANHPPRPLLRPAQAEERPRSGSQHERSSHDKSPDPGRRVVDQRERGLARRAAEDEDVGHRGASGQEPAGELFLCHQGRRRWRATADVLFVGVEEAGEVESVQERVQGYV